MTFSYTSSKSKKIFSIFLALLTILHGYAFFFAGSFSIAMMVISIYVILGFMKLITYKHINKIFYYPILMVVLYILLTLFSLIELRDYQISSTGILFNILKMGVWASVISVVGYFFFDYKIFSKIYIRIAFIATIFLLLQVIAINVFHISVPNAVDLGFIRPTYPEYIHVTDHGSSQLRMSSFWMEPSQYGNYIIGALIILLFDKNLMISNKNILKFLFVFGILVSTSSSAIFLMFVIFLIYIIINQFKYKFLNVLAIVLLLFFGIIFNFSILDSLQNVDGIGYSIYRAVTKLEYWRESARLGSSLDAIIAILKLETAKIIGLGVGNEILFLNSLGREFTYLNSIAKTIVWTGYCGLILYFIFIYKLIERIKFNLLSTILVFVCFIGGFYSGLWYSPDSMVFYLIALYHMKN
jgi:hypothetical protein